MPEFMTKIRWGIWGAGEIARVVAQDMRRTAGGILHAVGSRSERSARALAAPYGISRVGTDISILLDDPAIDVVYLATPHHLHAVDAVRCLRAGKAVLCEKPLAISAVQAGHIVDSARQTGRFCMEAMWTCFIPAVQHALQLAREGAIGEVVSMSGDFSHPVAFHPESRFFSSELAGGALLDRGVYLISVAQALLGEPERVQASVKKAPTGVDAHSAYLLEFANGVIAQFSASLMVRGSNCFIIEGDRGRITLHEPFVCAHRLTVEQYTPYMPTRGGTPPAGIKARLKAGLRGMGLQRRLDGLRWIRRFRASRSYSFAGNGYQFELDEVMRCLREGKTESVIMTLDRSLAVARTMDRLRSAWGRTDDHDSQLAKN
jgi:predicted dehydrogenase